MAKASETKTQDALEAKAERCVVVDESLVRAFDFLGKRWNAVVLGALAEGPTGFRELGRAINGISDSMLSNRLSDLAQAGLIVRKVEEGPPVAVSYALTNRGQALMPALTQISLWSQEHLLAEDCEAEKLREAAEAEKS